MTTLMLAQKMQAYSVSCLILVLYIFLLGFSGIIPFFGKIDRIPSSI